jgi:hypothetical protein
VYPSLVVDAVFGFSFCAPASAPAPARATQLAGSAPLPTAEEGTAALRALVRAPFDDLLIFARRACDPFAPAPALADAADVAGAGAARAGSEPGYIPLVCVDTPSGWDVDTGDVHRTGLVPALLVSLTAPKGCACALRQLIGDASAALEAARIRRRSGLDSDTGAGVDAGVEAGASGGAAQRVVRRFVHAVGGRFVPDDVRRKFGVPRYPYVGMDQSCVVWDTDVEL